MKRRKMLKREIRLITTIATTVLMLCFPNSEKSCFAGSQETCFIRVTPLDRFPEVQIAAGNGRFLLSKLVLERHQRISDLFRIRAEVVNQTNLTWLELRIECSFLGKDGKPFKSDFHSNNKIILSYDVFRDKETKPVKTGDVMTEGIGLPLQSEWLENITGLSAQIVSGTSLTDTPKNVGPIQTNYDRFEDITTLTLPTVLVKGQTGKDGQEADGTAVMFGVVFKGKRPLSMRFGNQYLLAVARGQQRGGQAQYREQPLRVIVDDQRIALNDVVKYEFTTKPKGGTLETIVFSLPYESLVMISGAKSVECRIGTDEFRFGEISKTSLQTLLLRILELTSESESEKN